MVCKLTSCYTKRICSYLREHNRCALSPDECEQKQQDGDNKVVGIFKKVWRQVNIVRQLYVQASSSEDGLPTEGLEEVLGFVNFLRFLHRRNVLFRCFGVCA